ncbi:CidA/LrgA family protein [Paenibacillus flagellatus]|uniref:CidA/LrgA family protein n=1 Tax=Paenibacillus flagellatus TaxID=2211139 RepID=A0A2V5L032_9BACL|nr:CidA/LrgA family protein [Paenibacillus flagellatus]PYI55896.1 CidA/LrgA family protein [Paenibacillus flagellatus]
MRGLAILLSFHFAGLLVRQLLHVPLPANVLGLVLFVASLFAGWVKLEWVEESAQFLLRHMMLFFAPFIVGTIVFFPVIADQAVGIGLSLVLGTLLVLLVTGKVTDLLSNGKEEERDERSGMVE